MSASTTTTKHLNGDLPSRVHSLVRAYVQYRTEQKAGLKWSDFKDKKVRDAVSGRESIDVPGPYREARLKVCNDAFLRIRSCRVRDDFVNYFAGTICSVPQYLPEQEYQLIAQALLDGDRWEEIRTLSMLALSAQSSF